MKGWYEDYKDLRRDMIRQSLDEVHFYEEDCDIAGKRVGEAMQ